MTPWRCVGLTEWFLWAMYIWWSPFGAKCRIAYFYCIWSNFQISSLLMICLPKKSYYRTWATQSKIMKYNLYKTQFYRYQTFASPPSGKLLYVRRTISSAWDIGFQQGSCAPNGGLAWDNGLAPCRCWGVFSLKQVSLPGGRYLLMHSLKSFAVIDTSSSRLLIVFMWVVRQLSWNYNVFLPVARWIEWSLVQ